MHISERFRIIELLGQGGMGKIYRSVDTHHGDREVGLKVLDGQASPDASELLRFKDEYRVMTQLRHPNTIDVFDFGLFEDGRAFFTMEVVDGEDLATRIRPGGMRLDEVYSILMSVLQAIEFIHARGFIHRDIKPQNVRIRHDGVVKLIDFGIMEPIGSSDSGELFGTMAYLAPEVFQGGVVDVTTDLYSLGCMAYEMVTGRVPFLGSPTEVLSGHCMVEPAPVRQLRPDAPLRLESILSKLLAKSQIGRYQDAAEVIIDLSALAGSTVVRQNLDQKRSYLVASNLVGREKELQRLHEIWADVVRGDCREVFIGGTAGVGKSRLAQELLIHAKLQAAKIMSVTCVEAGMVAYQAVDQLFGARLTSELGSDESIGDRRENVHFITNLLRKMTETSAVLVFVDDLQWCDVQSLEVLLRIFRDGQLPRVLFLGTLRTDEVPIGGPLWLACREPATINIETGPLDQQQVRALLVSLLRRIHISEEAVATLYESTGGNAFFITEMLRYLVEQDVLVFSEGHWSFPFAPTRNGLPTSIEATVLRRLSRASSEALDLARVASVLGRYQDLEALLMVSGFDHNGLFERLEELVQRQFLTREASRCVFAHDRVREALYADIPDARRRELHQRYAEYLETRGLEKTSNSELAYHYRRGTDKKKAFQYLYAAGNEAKSIGADGMAIDYWRQALELLPKLDLPDALTITFELHSRIAKDGIVVWPEVGLESAEICVRMLEAEGNADFVCNVLRRVVQAVNKLPKSLRDHILSELQRPVAYTHRSRQGLLRHLPPSPASWIPALIEALAAACVCAGMAGQPHRGLLMGRRALKLIPFVDSPLQGATMTALGGCLQSAGHFDELSSVLVLACKLLFKDKIEKQEIFMSARVGIACYSNARVFQGERFDAEFVKMGESDTAEFRKPDFYNNVWAYPMIWHAWTGRWSEALDYCAKIMQNCRTVGVPPFPWEIYVRAYCAWLRGAYDDAKLIVDEALDLPHVSRLLMARECLGVVRGLVLIDLGDIITARAQLVALELRVNTAGMNLVRIQALLALGRCEFRAGNLDTAANHGDVARKLAASGPARNPLHEAIAERLLGDIECARGQFNAAIGHFEASLKIVTTPKYDNPYEKGRLYQSLGELEQARGQNEAAREHYQRARTEFTQLDLRHLLRFLDARLESCESMGRADVNNFPREDMSPAPLNTTAVIDTN